jgi:hypothetical protein
MLTTTPTTRPASWAKSSANGVSGGWARLGATIVVKNANDAATMAPRRPEILTPILLAAAAANASRPMLGGADRPASYRELGSGAGLFGTVDMK